MPNTRKSPYICHVLVCTNDRQGRRKSCADGNSAQVRAALKKEVGDRGWRGKVRVSPSGCLGLCADGPNVLIYPQKIWFPGVSTADVPDIVARMAQIVDTA